jgi:glycosyltransferase involved in cell wall biosynthesis
MQYEPLVSIIINCYNGEKFLKQTLLSVLNQSYKNWELIFWDNKSTDNSKKIYNLFKDSRCKYYYSNKHTNLVLARYYALKKIKGDYFCFLDADDVWQKDKILQQVALLVKENVGFVYSNTIIFNNNKKKILFDKEKPSGNIYADLLEDYFIPDETVVFSKKILLKNKIKLNTSLNYIPNFDLTMQYAKTSKVVYCNKVLSKWRVNNKSLTWRKNKEIYNDVNNWLSNQNKKENNSYIKKKVLKAINKNHLRYARSLMIDHGNIKTIKFLLLHFNMNISFFIMFFISCIPLAPNFLRFRRKKLFLN